MKVVSYNLNGLRAALNKGLADWINKDRADVYCFQEIKAQAAQVDKPLFELLGYNIYSFSAEKKGYSGVAILSKQQPDHVVYGMNNEKYDKEGRVIRADYGDLSIMCVYVPSGTMGGVRQEYKMQFLADFSTYIKEIRKERPNLLICGDFNICHKPIDINNPKRQVGVSGFLPEEREWMDGFEALGFTDTFRVFDPNPEKYTWWSHWANSRARNVGWRIDYHWVCGNLREKLQAGNIMPDVHHSDHCPVSVEIQT